MATGSSRSSQFWIADGAFAVTNGFYVRLADPIVGTCKRPRRRLPLPYRSSSVHAIILGIARGGTFAAARWFPCKFPREPNSCSIFGPSLDVTSLDQDICRSSDLRWKRGNPAPEDRRGRQLACCSRTEMDGSPTWRACTYELGGICHEPPNCANQLG